MKDSGKVSIIGGTESALRLLKLCIENQIPLSCCLIQKNDPHESPLAFNETMSLLEHKKIPVLVVDRFSENEAQFLRNHQVAVAFVINCRFMIPKKFLSLLPGGFLVTHGSLLPEDRGFAPLNWAIINGKKEIGLTLFRADAKVDSGPVLLQRKFELKSGMNASDVFQTFVANQPEMFIEYYFKKDQIGSGTQQDEAIATYCCRRSPEDGFLDFNQSAESLEKLIRASQSPYPYAFTFLRMEKISIVSAELCPNSLKYSGRVPGRVGQVSKKEGWADVICQDRAIRIHEVLYRGKVVKASDVLNTTRITLGVSVLDVINLQAELADLKQRLSQLERASN